MEKKKLKKLRINKMQDLPVIGVQEQIRIKGGGDPLGDAFEWALYDLGLSVQDVEDFFQEVGDKIENVAIYGVELLKDAAEFTLTGILGGPFSAPFLFLDSPALYESFGIGDPGSNPPSS